jgi:hypothetical protein
MFLSELSHSELKAIADEFDIQADRRSKAAILEAISCEEIEVLNRIADRLSQEV